MSRSATRLLRTISSRNGLDGGGNDSDQRRETVRCDKGNLCRAAARRDTRNATAGSISTEIPVTNIVISRAKGVSDGTRTRGRRDHNPELYQLSYAHQADCEANLAARGPLRRRQDAGPRAPAR